MATDDDIAAGMEMRFGEITGERWYMDFTHFVCFQDLNAILGSILFSTNIQRSFGRLRQ
jgi:hypothetical protein